MSREISTLHYRGREKRRKMHQFEFSPLSLSDINFFFWGGGAGVRTFFYLLKFSLVLEKGQMAKLRITFTEYLIFCCHFTW